MKRSLFVLMALLIATPALGTVTITCIDEGQKVVRIDYQVVNEPAKVRAFALDVSVDVNCAIITDINDYTSGEGNQYGIYPGTIDLSDLNSPPIWGTPIAPSSDPGAEDTGLGTNRVILEMGSLYEPNLTGPPNSGTLCRLKFQKAGASGSCHITIVAETTRGGVVLENGTTVSIVSTGCDVNIEEGPDCWSWLGQCHGDSYGNDLKVDIDDFYSFKDAFGSSFGGATYDPCPDSDRDGDVDIDDFYIFKDAFIVTDVPGDCPTGGTWPPF